MIRVVLVDDQPLIRTGLRVLISDAPDLTVVGEAGNGAQAVELVRETRPDVAVMDIRMPGMDGIEATRRITADQESQTTHVLILTTFDDDDYVYGALRAGASGFLVKDMRLETILDGIRTLAAGDALIAPSVTRRLIEEFAARPEPSPSLRPGGPPATPLVAVDGITDREREVLTLVGRGLSNTEIAAELFITVATAKAHIARLFTKLSARDRVHLVILAYEFGLVSSTR
ncbi:MULTISPECIES: response regulator transcription factor [unclassified Streptomyces]|uniref:response regulator n=1 Tax=unclassified Streptomyces TaxID=2593676 RepID=UPI001BE9C9AC|nr:MULTISPECIES: response regulator transcription factor [unclassified Streptomyces]MBT2406198.1 response regulator transcription factor [Streptomyces sp. ISL-21]MBT2459019.1 response regulator transcription factor [Streptomyces sp. ISL-86]MBT2609498.1 response regulator transcription factor [Streptomyces sp. ISL-87]